jgi:hypothetical protein
MNGAAHFDPAGHLFIELPGAREVSSRFRVAALTVETNGESRSKKRHRLSAQDPA